MATSGSTDFTLTAAQVIDDALIECNAISPNETPTSDEYAHALRVLNKMLKHWQMIQGYNIFRRQRDTLTIVADKGDDAAPYTFGGSGSPDKAYRMLRVESMRYKPTNGNELPMMHMTRDEYDQLPDKDVSGTPTNFVYEPGNAQGQLFIWPVPSSASGELVYTYQRIFEDMDATSNNFDLPQEWLESITYSLAARLHRSYFPTDAQGRAELMQQAASSLRMASSFDRDQGSFFLTRDG